VELSLAYLQYKDQLIQGAFEEIFALKLSLGNEVDVFYFRTNSGIVDALAGKTAPVPSFRPVYPPKVRYAMINHALRRGIAVESLGLKDPNEVMFAQQDLKMLGFIQQCALELIPKRKQGHLPSLCDNAHSVIANEAAQVANAVSPLGTFDMVRFLVRRWAKIWSDKSYQRGYSATNQLEVAMFYGRLFEQLLLSSDFLPTPTGDDPCSGVVTTIQAEVDTWIEKGIMLKTAVSVPESLWDNYDKLFAAEAVAQELNFLAQSHHLNGVSVYKMLLRKAVEYADALNQGERYRVVAAENQLSLILSLLGEADSSFSHCSVIFLKENI
jgi:hypothetical protein